jgi:hypothetical protein
MASDVEMRELPCKLTEAELLQRGDAMADAELAIDKLKDKRTKITKKIGEKRKERFELGVVIDRGEEARDVRCVWIEDFTHNCKRLVRQDTGDTVEEATMTAEDRQLAMEEPGQPGEDETIDLDDVPDDDVDPDDLDDEGLDDEGDDTPEPEQPTTKTRGRQPQPQA